MTKHDIIDSIAQERTDNAEVAELESLYYENQYDKLEEWSIDELIDTYKTYFDDYEQAKEQEV